MEELKCPYCGKELEIVFRDLGRFWERYFYCRNCKNLYRRNGFKLILVRRKVINIRDFTWQDLRK